MSLENGDGPARNPRPLVLCGPSGSGKSALLKRLLNEYKDTFAPTVSHTTRLPRPGEIDGVHYHFVSRDQMLEMIKRNEFIEHTEYTGNLYGTSKEAIRNVQNSGRACLMDIDIEGVKRIRNTDLNPLFVFVKPPNPQVMEERLRRRGTEDEDVLRKRIARATIEMEYGATTGNFDLIIINDSLDVAYDQLKRFVESAYF